MQFTSPCPLVIVTFKCLCLADRSQEERLQVWVWTHSGRIEYTVLFFAFQIWVVVARIWAGGGNVLPSWLSIEESSFVLFSSGHYLLDKLSQSRITC